MADVVLDEWGWSAGSRRNSLQPGSTARAPTQTSHRWVLTDDIVDAYERRIHHARYKGGIWRRLQGSFIDTLVSASRLWLREVPIIDGAYDGDDVAWVSAAAAAPAGCLLVTGDRRLLVQLGKTGLPEQHAFAACFVTDALELLDPRQPALS